MRFSSFVRFVPVYSSYLFFFVLPLIFALSFSALLHSFSFSSRVSRAFPRIIICVFFILSPSLCINARDIVKFRHSSENSKFSSVRPGHVKITEFRRRHCGLFGVKPFSPNGLTLSTVTVVGPRNTAANLGAPCTRV